ncbi:MAG TPA: hypothetical protein VMV92_18830 [Streptosporangiaceae bacterium]|nr:hypothetical protein [Streptosporangiaceae bacterium]
MESPLTPGYLRGGQFARAIRACSRAEAQVELLTAYLDDVGIAEALAELTESSEDEDRPAMGEMRRKMRQRRTLPALDALNRAGSRAASLRGRLGLDPASYAALAKDVSLAKRAGEHDPLEKMAAGGREIVKRRAARAAPGQARRGRPRPCRGHASAVAARYLTRPSP